MPALPHRRRLASSVAVSLLFLVAAACGAPPAPDPSPSVEVAASSPTPVPTPVPTPRPTPEPSPTPSYTNAPDPELAALFPELVAGAPLVVAEGFALTPGDIAEPFGEIGLRFRSLAIAYTESPAPRLSAYAMRLDGRARNRDLEPHLAEIGRYVGIAGLDPEPWELVTVAGKQVWARPEDDATAAGTMIYTWAVDDLAFLVIGTDAATNEALVAALPAPPAPTPRPSPTPSAAPAESPPAPSP